MTAEKITTPSAEALAEAARAAMDKRQPPVESWAPPLSGQIDIEIKRDGTWWHEGDEIRREGLVRLFASILKREGDAYFLVTPVEKWQIRVEDAPFLAVDMDAAGEGDGQAIVFTTNVGDTVLAGEVHPIRVAHDPVSGEPAPYVMVRAGLEARIDRKSFYRLMERCAVRDGWLGLWSDRAFFPVMREEEAEA